MRRPPAGSGWRGHAPRRRPRRAGHRPRPARGLRSPPRRRPRRAHRAVQGDDLDAQTGPGPGRRPPTTAVKSPVHVAGHRRQSPRPPAPLGQQVLQGGEERLHVPAPPVRVNPLHPFGGAHGHPDSLGGRLDGHHGQARRRSGEGGSWGRTLEGQGPRHLVHPGRPPTRARDRDGPAFFDRIERGARCDLRRDQRDAQGALADAGAAMSPHSMRATAPSSTSSVSARSPTSPSDPVR